MHRVSANAIAALKEALSAAFWFKRDLQRYASAAVAGEPTYLAGIDWTGQYKRDSVDFFVDRLVRAQDEHPELLLDVLVDVAAMDSFPGLVRAEDAERRMAEAREAVARLKRLVAPYEQVLLERQRAQERISIATRAAQQRRATTERLEQLKASYMQVMGLAPQARGYAFERLLEELFDAFDLEPRGSFRVVGEQIDGGFTLTSEHFVLEAKWQAEPSAREDLDVLDAKVRRRGENTLGLFVAISGFQATAIDLHSGRRSPLMLMDGGDLFAVLDQRIELPDLLHHKRRETSMTGRVFLPAGEVLTVAGR